MNEKFIPNLFILGAAKCGTTTLHSYLSRLPDVCMSKPKEPFYFEAYFDKGLGFYKEKYFRHWRGEPVIGEARHRNLIQPYVPQRIYETNPDAKLLVIVRNPTDRAYSHWYHLYSRFSEPLLFKGAIQEDYARIRKGLCCSTDEEIEKHISMLSRQAPGNVLGKGLYRTYVDSGYYFDQVQRYLEYFPSTSLKVILLEDLARKPLQVLNEISSFLEIRAPNVEMKLGSQRHNRAKNFPDDLKPLSLRVREWTVDMTMQLGVQRLKRINIYEYFKDMGTTRWLRRHYMPHNQKLGDFLRRDLSSWDQDGTK